MGVLLASFMKIPKKDPAHLAKRSNPGVLVSSINVTPCQNQHVLLRIEIRHNKVFEGTNLNFAQ